MATTDKENLPVFVSIKKDPSDPEALVETEEGSLKEIALSDDHKHIYKISGFFTMKYIGHQHILTMVGLRAFSTCDDLLEKNKVSNGTFFGCVE